LRAGTLTYTPKTLRTLFGWLLAGDVLFTLCEKIESNILPVILKSHQATDTQIAIIITTIQAIVTGIATPIASYRSDRKRSKWGRRIPYILWGTPLLTIAMMATPFAPELGHWMAEIPWLQPALNLFDASPVIIAFGLLAIFYRTLQSIVNSMYFALFRDVVPMSHMGRFLGLFRIFGSASTFIATFWLIGLAETHSRSIFIVGALINLVCFTLICFNVKEGQYPPEPDEHAHAGDSWWKRAWSVVTIFVKDAYSDPLIFWTFCTRGMAYAATGILSFMIFFPNRELGIPLDRAGMILSAPTFLWILAAYPTGKLMDKIGAAPILGFSLLTCTVVYGLSFFFVTGPITFAISTTIAGVAYWAILLSQLQLAQEIFPLSRYGQLSSANQLQTALLLTVIITPLVGWTLDSLHAMKLVLPLPGLGDLSIGPYRSVNLMLALVFILAWLCLKKVERLRAQRLPAPGSSS
jgi:MFS family permease